MDNGNFGIFLLIAGPAVLGIVALFVGMALLRKPKGAPFNSATRTVFGVLCLLLTLGVGICYGVLFLTR